MPLPITLEMVRDAAERIRPYIHRTPVLTSAHLDQRAGATVFLKCENFQRVGAFKMRGAANAVFSLDETTAARGVVTHSSGNHAQAVARAAAERGIRATIVMPTGASAVKRSAVAGYGAQIVDCDNTLAAREQTAAQVAEGTGGALIHAYNDPLVIAGQGTAALELLDQAGPLDAVITPVGGGGLASGTAVVVSSLAPQASVWAGEPALADDAYRSLQAGRPEPVLRTDTIADGLRTALGSNTFAVISKLVAGILLVSEEQIVAATRLLWERVKIVVEPSGAVPVAALLANRERFAGKRIGLVLTGGNVDLDHLPWSA